MLITTPRSQYCHHFPDAETDKLRNIQLVRGGANVSSQVSVKLQGFPFLLYSFIFSIRSLMLRLLKRLWKRVGMDRPEA